MLKSAVEINKIAFKTARFLSAYIKIKRAYLFGSYACGKPHKYSDIDLAFFSPTVERMGIERKMTILSIIQEKVGSGVEIHLYPEKCLKEARPTNFYGYILKTGKRILQ